MDFGVLGPVEVRARGVLVDAGHARRRAVLAVLLLELGRVVSAEALIDRVWGEDPPPSVRNVLYGHVARLRAALAGAGDGGVSLSRRGAGYLLQADPEQVDLYRFRGLTGEAGAAAGDDVRAGALLGQALCLWRGPALAGLASGWLDRMRASLELERTAAVLDLTDVRLRQGQHAGLVAELVAQATATPADERLIGQLMLALYRSGRQADALRWFEQTRQHLADEFGADPAPQLRALHQQILRADPALALPEPEVSAGATPAGPAPRQLPADVAAFTGRTAELAELDKLLADAGDRRVTGVVISAVSGTAGVGKTALAVHWAHRVAERFPDGQLHVNLRGYDPAQPLTAGDALAVFLRALGVNGQDITADEDERAARYRSLLAGKRILIVLDNASDTEQVRPLLPGTAACAVLVTSRDALAGLVARHGAVRIDLDLLPLPDAVSLLCELIGDRAAADPEATAPLARLCCRLPLALRIAAELATARPAVPLASLVAELGDQRRRLDLLEAGGDPRTAVRAVFSWSYQHLDADAARAFRLAGLHPGPELEPYALAALTGTGLEQARQALDVLVQAHLIQRAGHGRYGLHDLLRAYAAELAAQDSEDEQRAALTRLFDYYLHAAAAAMDSRYPAERHRRPRILEPGSPVPALTDPPEALAWLEAELASLVSVTAHAAAHGWPTHAIRLAVTLFRHLDTGGHLSEGITIHTHARGAARQIGDRAAEAGALNDLGVAHQRQSRYEEAVGHFQDALALHGDVGNQTGQARALHNLGLVEFAQGSYRQAVTHFEHALALHRKTGDQAGQATALNSLGIADGQQGRYQLAAGHFQDALALYRDTGDRRGEARALHNLAVVGYHLGSYDAAADHYRQHLALIRETGDRNGEADVLVGLGAIDLKKGRYQRAADHHRQALAVFRETGNRAGEAEALNGMGEAFVADGRGDDARARHAEALGLASQIGDKYQQARAHNGLGHAQHITGDPRRSRYHWERALTLYTELGVPEADEVRVQIAASSGQEHRHECS
jgi:DNA-binding SARP family transcriptional activator/Flp pilus assembly protein TadD